MENYNSGDLVFLTISQDGGYRAGASYPVKGSKYEAIGTITDTDRYGDGRVVEVKWVNGHVGNYLSRWLVRAAAPVIVTKVEYIPNPIKLAVFADEKFYSINNGVTIMNEAESLIFINKKRYFKQK